MTISHRRSCCAAWILIQLAFALLLPTARSNDDGLAIAAVLADRSVLAGAHDIQIRDGLAYLAGKGGSLAIVDVREPVAPKLVWSVRDATIYEDAETVLALGGHRLLVGTRDLLLFDMEQPTKTKLLAEVRDRSRVDRVNGFARVGDVVFAAGKSGNIIGIDVSEANSLKVLGSRNLRELDGLASPHDVALSDGLLLVVSPEGFGRSTQSGKLAIYRVVDPETQQPLPADRWSLVGRMEHRRLAGANRVRTRGRFAYVGCSLAQNKGRTDDLKSSVCAIDISLPEQPRLAASVDFPDARGPNGLEIAGSIVFAAGGQTVLALDISDASTLRQIGRLTAPRAFPGGEDDAHDLVYSNGHLFVTAQTSHSLVVIKLQSSEIQRAVGR